MIISEFPNFIHAKERLSKAIRTSLERTIKRFQGNPDLPGLNVEKLHHSNDWWSLRVNDDVRVIFWRGGDHVYFGHVDHHKAAYRWSESHSFTIEAQSGTPVLTYFEDRAEVVHQVVPIKNDETLLFSHLKPEYVLSLGVPTQLIEHIRSAVTESNFHALIDQLEEPTWNNLDDLRSGNTPRGLVPTSSELGKPENATPWISLDQQELREAVHGGFDRWSIFLHPSQRNLIDRTLAGPGRVFGIAGSGKSIVGLYRAVRLARASTSSAILLTAHTPNVVVKLKRDLDLLLDGDIQTRDRITVDSLAGCATNLWQRLTGSAPTIASEEYLTVLLGDLKTVHSQTEVALIVEEWLNVVEQFGLKTLAEYQGHARTSRSASALGYENIWSMICEGRDRLIRKRRHTLPGIFFELAQKSKQTQQQFTNVVVDESQLFTPVELAFIRKLAPVGKDDLFFCEDRRQSIRKGAFKWSDVGIEVKGRSFGLHVNYRTTEQIWKFSDRIVQSGDSRDTTDNPPTSLMTGTDPEVLSCADLNEEIETIGIRLISLAREGFLANEIAIISRSSETLQLRAEPATRMAGVRSVEVRKESKAIGRYISLVTMENVIGLEFRAVIIIGCDAAGTNGPSDRIAGFKMKLPPLWKQNPSLLYTACTRARERLIITGIGPTPEYLTGSLGQEPPSQMIPRPGVNDALQTLRAS